MSKFPLSTVALVKRGHPLWLPHPPTTNSVHQWGRDGAGGEAGYEGEEERRGAKTPDRRQEKKRRKEKESARPATAVARAQLFPKLFPAPKEERQLHEARLEVLRGSGERRSVRRAAGSLALARGVGAGDAAAGARGHWRPPGPPPHPPRQAVGGRRCSGKRLPFIRSRTTACCHRLRSRVGTARDPERPRWRRGNLRALRAAPTPPPLAWRRPLPPPGGGEGLAAALPSPDQGTAVCPHLLLPGSPQVVSNSAAIRSPGVHRCWTPFHLPQGRRLKELLLATT